MQREAVTPAAADSAPAPEPLVTEPTDVPAEPATPTAVDLLGERPIRVEEPPTSTPVSPAAAPTTAAPAVQRAASRPEEPHAGRAGSSSRSVAPVQRTAVPTPPAVPPVAASATAVTAQRTADSAVPLPLAPPALAWPPPPPAAKPTPVRPVPAPGLTVQAVAADQLPAPPRSPRPSSASPRSPSRRRPSPPARARRHADGVRPGTARSRTAHQPGRDGLPRVGAHTTAPPAGPAAQVQRSAATMTPVPVASRPPAPASPSAPTYESMPASIRSMPLQRLFSAATPQAPRPDLPTRSSGPAPGPADHVDHPEHGRRRWHRGRDPLGAAAGNSAASRRGRRRGRSGSRARDTRRPPGSPPPSAARHRRPRSPAGPTWTSSPDGCTRRCRLC